MQAGGSIILTGSTSGSMGTPAFSVYSATKAAIRNFARSWALDLRKTGIRVNVLSPGPTATMAKFIAARDFNQFPPARKGVLAMLITLVLGETG